jgi:hypothetical protein
MDQPHYETSDKYLGSFLLANGIPIVTYTRVSARRVVFRFGADERLHELLRHYRGLTPLLVVPLRLVASLQHLKRLARGCRLAAADGPIVPQTTPATAGEEPAATPFTPVC